jgi:glycosyltransferase involved in cell wall biosynthesis
VGAVTEAVIDEQTGLIVDVTQPEQLAKATERLASSRALRNQLGLAGRQWVEEYFLSEVNSHKMAKIYRST